MALEAEMQGTGVIVAPTLDIWGDATLATKETANTIAALGTQNVGLLATTGTINTQLYQEACARKGISVLTLKQKSKPESNDLNESGIAW